MTLVRRGGSWGVKVWDPSARKHIWLGTRSTEAEALQLEQESELAAKAHVPSVKVWASIWLSDYARPAPATRLVYAQAARRITNDLGARRLDSLTRVEARQWANRWPRNITAVARSMWNDAKEAEVCKENPWANLRLKQSRGRKEIRALTEAEVRELAGMAGAVHGDFGPEARAIIEVLAYTGMRPGEVCGLRWEDLDLSNLEAHVRRSVDVTRQEKKPKNGRERKITLPPPAVRALRGVQRIVGESPAYVFHTVQGRRQNKANLFYIWRPVRAAWLAAGHRDIDMYDLRHTAATMLAERGVDASTIAVQLGHTDGGILCMRLYCHPSEDRARERLKMAYAETPENVWRDANARSA